MEPEFWKVSQAERATRMADLRKNGMTVEPAAKEVLDGIDRLLEKAQVPIAEMRGMTLLPNAVLERKSARIGCWSRAAFATCSKSAWSDATTCSTCA